MKKNPCLDCGACCAFYRASFYWTEADDISIKGVPVNMTDEHPPYYRIMKGTNSKQPYCIALKGIIGVNVFCSIYENRSSVCKAFIPSWENGEHNERCDKARAFYGLKPITPEYYDEHDKPPTPLKPAA